MGLDGSDLSSFEKPSMGDAIFFAFLYSRSPCSVGGRDTDITLEGQESVLPRAVRMTFIVPIGRLKEMSFHVSMFASPCQPLE